MKNYLFMLLLLISITQLAQAEDIIEKHEKESYQKGNSNFSLSFYYTKFFGEMSKYLGIANGIDFEYNHKTKYGYYISSNLMYGFINDILIRNDGLRKDYYRQYEVGASLGIKKLYLESSLFSPFWSLKARANILVKQEDFRYYYNTAKNKYNVISDEFELTWLYSAYISVGANLNLSRNIVLIGEGGIQYSILGDGYFGSAQHFNPGFNKIQFNIGLQYNI